MVVLATVEVKAQLTDRRQATSRRKASRLDTVFQIGNDLLVLTFVFFIPDLPFDFCYIVTFFFPSWQCLECFSRSHLGANVVYLGVRFIE